MGRVPRREAEWAGKSGQPCSQAATARLDVAELPPLSRVSYRGPEIAGPRMRGLLRLHALPVFRAAQYSEVARWPPSSLWERG